MTTITITIDALYGIDTNTFFPGSQPTVNVASTQNANVGTLDFRLNTGSQSDFFHTYRLEARGDTFSINPSTLDVSGRVREFTMTELSPDSPPNQLMHMKIDLTDHWAAVGGIAVPSFAGLTAGSFLNMIGQQGPANLVLIGGIGNDTLRGTFYGDTLQGGQGADRLLGGAGNDTASYAGSTAAVTVNLATKAASGGDATGDTLDSIENVIGSGLNDTLTGNEAGNVIQGLGGLDTIRGAGGNDAIFGGDGGGTFYGDAGNDRIDGGADSDTIHGGAGDDDLRGGNGAANTIYGEDGKDLILGGNGIDKLYGGADNDTMEAGNGAGAGGTDILDGGTGADNMTSGAGAGYFYVDNAGDMIADGFDGDGDRVLTSVSYVLTTFAHIERFTTTSSTGTGAVNLTGNEYVQTIQGNAGANVINGKGGADTMQGLGGNDTYYVDNSNDKVIEGANGGTLDRVFASTSYALGAGVQVEFLAPVDTTATLALNFFGNEFAQTIRGDAGSNYLDGMAGADTLQGFQGDDEYFVDNAGDRIIEVAGQGTADRVTAFVSYTLTAGAAVEKIETIDAAAATAINLTGNEFSQIIKGNAGDNRLEGREGSDTLHGFAGKDTFVFNTAPGSSNVDTVVDFNVADDRFLLSDAVFKALNTGILASGYFRANTTGLAQDANDHIIYETDTGELYYDANGTGSGGGILFAKIAVGLGLTNADFSVA